MNNHNNGEPRLDENPFDGIIQRALLHRQNGRVDTARQRSAGSEYQATLSGTGLSGSDRNMRCDLRNSDGVSKGICQHHHMQCACKDMHHVEKIEEYEARYDKIIKYGLEINPPPQKEPRKRRRAKNGSVFILDS